MLQGKVAVITGSGRGLGREIALAMSEHGARLALMSRSLDELSEVAEKIKTHGGSVLVFPGDIAEERSVRQLVTKTMDAFSTVDILVNNAAVIGPPSIISATDNKDWRRTLSINLLGAYNVTRSVLPMMIQKQSGKIINITSGLGQRPYSRFCAYSVSKAGLIQLTRSLSEELKEYNIQVNAIDPGVMNTKMQSGIRNLDEKALGSEVYQRFHMLYEQRLLKDAGEVAPLAVFLASKATDHLTGHNGTLDHYRNFGFRIPSCSGLKTIDPDQK